ncbi:helix-turn-helix transcriptional regulator [Thalassotalea sp. PLHSN55]|uniref:helix-turn-helix transcriptional regulator n=1 Tax=Thalassotalea sp. PLHSN55 TaxID=3435888 RepID=UPI003F865EC6
MPLNIRFKLCRQPELLELFGFKKSTLYTRIAKGLMVPPVSLGERSVAWPEHELQHILRAICANKSPDEIKALVAKLIAQRNELA